MLIVRNIENDYLAAGNPQTSPQELYELSNSENVRVRQRVAENKNICLSTLFRLFFDGAPEVRLATVDNPIAPEFFLDHLVRDTSSDIRYNLAENPHLKLKHLKELARDENPYIRQRAKKTIESKTRICPDLTNYRKAC